MKIFPYSSKGIWRGAVGLNQGFGNMSAQRQEASKSNIALERHCKAVHAGKEDPNCNACKELRKKLGDK